MKRNNLQELTDDELIERFAQIGIAQDDALLGDEIGKFNTLYPRKKAIEQELKARPGDRRRLLQRFYDHENAQVRRNAAVATLTIEPMAARRVLELIIERKQFPQALDAGMLLSGLDDGSYQPT